MTEGYDNHKVSDIHWAMWQASPFAIKRALDDGEDINARDSNEATPLMYLVARARNEVNSATINTRIKDCLEAVSVHPKGQKIDVTLKDEEGYDALDYAAYMKAFSVLSALKRMRPANYQPDVAPETELDEAHQSLPTTAEARQNSAASPALY